MVICRNCTMTFIALFTDSMGQAHRCASNIFEREEGRFLIGHYGSTVADGHLYKVLTDKHKPGIICDACIEQGIEAGDFELLSDNNYFGIDL